MTRTKRLTALAAIAASATLATALSVSTGGSAVADVPALEGPSHQPLASPGISVGTLGQVSDAAKMSFHRIALRSIENGLMSGNDECMQQSAGWIEELIGIEKSLNASYGTVDMPYD